MIYKTDGCETSDPVAAATCGYPRSPIVGTLERVQPTRLAGPPAIKVELQKRILTVEMLMLGQLT